VAIYVIPECCARVVAAAGRCSLDAACATRRFIYDAVHIEKRRRKRSRRRRRRREPFHPEEGGGAAARSIASFPPGAASKVARVPLRRCNEKIGDASVRNRRPLFPRRMSAPLFRRRGEKLHRQSSKRLCGCARTLLRRWNILPSRDASYRSLAWIPNYP